MRSDLGVEGNNGLGTVADFLVAGALLTTAAFAGCIVFCVVGSARDGLVFDGGGVLTQSCLVIWNILFVVYSTVLSL